MNNNKTTIVYIADTSPLKTPEIFDRFYEKLSETRKEKVNGYRFMKDKILSVGAGILLDFALDSFDIDGNREMTFTDSGKPFLKYHPEINFNISHSEEKVICGISYFDIGCDIEKTEENKVRIADRFFAPDEAAYLSGISREEQPAEFYRIWTMKESFIKCTGEGLSRSLNSFSVDTDKMIVKCPEEDEYHLFEKETDGYKISVCLKNPGSGTIDWNFTDFKNIYEKENHR